MKVAIISDIHGNAVALETVLEKAASLGVEQLLVLGDLVGYYYQPAAVLAMLDEWSIHLVQGNHEAMLSKAMTDKQYMQWAIQKYGHGIDIAANELTTDQLTMLFDASNVKNVEIDNCNFLLCHGAPWDRDAYIYPDAEDTLLVRCAENQADFMLMGHTHYPFMSLQNETLIINPGSVGQARDVGGYACWAIVDTENCTVVQHRTKYDTRKVEATAKRVDPERPMLCEILRRNRD